VWTLKPCTPSGVDGDALSQTAEPGYNPLQAFHTKFPACSQHRTACTKDNLLNVHA
jgi:hypothetical protein